MNWFDEIDMIVDNNDLDHVSILTPKELIKLFAAQRADFKILKIAILKIMTGLLDCKKCGKNHPKDFPYQPKDGHIYHAEDCAETANKAFESLAEHKAVENGTYVRRIPDDAVIRLKDPFENER